MTDTNLKTPDSIPAPSSTRNRFGTFEGVFTPSILTILGVIMFMSAGKVVGHAGVWRALGILLICKSITFLTSLSISAISTNTEMRGGGAYYMITRSLGLELGGSIGITLYLAQALSVPFYLIGLIDALKGFGWFAHVSEGHDLYFALGFALIFFIITYIGAGLAMKMQTVILAILSLAIVSFMIGLGINANWSRFAVNAAPASGPNHVNYWVLFAIYFPAVTGIMAGVNMSGDLKDPARSIPRGTLAAVGVGFLVYAAQMILMGAGIDRAELISSPYHALTAVTGRFAIFVTLGAIAATASSALGSFIGAPRVLQAVGRDRLFRLLNRFAEGTKKGDEPRPALWITGLITIITLIVAYGSSDDALDSVAAVLTMFFLATYGMTNVSAFVEAAGKNPSFRPRFRYFHWLSALVGALACVATGLLINWIAAMTASFIITIIYLYLATRHMTASFGDARRGFTYTHARNAIVKLRAMPADAKNWRPNIVVLSGNPHTRYTLVRYALWMEAGRGLITLAHFIEGDIREQAGHRKQTLADLNHFIRDNRFPAFSEVIMTENFDDSLSVFLQGHSIGPLKPNVIMLGWPETADRADTYVSHLQVAKELDMSLLALIDRGMPNLLRTPRLDIWWRGLENGSLMMILAHLITQTHEWNRAEIRILRVVRSDAEKSDAERELEELIQLARMRANAHIVVSDKTFSDVLHDQSKDATVVFLGFRLPDIDDAKTFYDTYDRLLNGLPTSILICSSGKADLYA